MAIITPVNAAEFITAFNTTADDGDTIDVTALTGTLDCSATPLETTKYFSIIGPGRTVLTIRCNMQMFPTVAGQDITISGFNIDTTNSNDVTSIWFSAAVGFTNGNYAIDDLGVEGPPLDDVTLMTLRSHGSNLMTAVLRLCYFDNNDNDLLSAVGGADTANNLASSVNIYDSEFSRRGSGGSDQYWTSHNSVPMIATRCNGSGFFSGSGGGASVFPGSNTVMELYDCNVEGQVGADKMVGGSITVPTGESVGFEAKDWGGNGFLLSGVRIVAVSGSINWVVKNDEHSGRIENCLIDARADENANYGVWLEGAGDVEIVNNTILGVVNAVWADGTASGTYSVFNDILEGSTLAIDDDSGGSATWNVDYNVYSVATDEAGPNDIIDVPDLDAFDKPIPEGNCDRNGGSDLAYTHPYDFYNTIRKIGVDRSIGGAEPNFVVDSSAFFEDLSDRRGYFAGGQPLPASVVELDGGDLIEMTAWEPDAATFRGEYYYHTVRNVLYKKVAHVVDEVPVATWQKISV